MKVALYKELDKKISHMRIAGRTPRLIVAPLHVLTELATYLPSNERRAIGESNIQVSEDSDGKYHFTADSERLVLTYKSIPVLYFTGELEQSPCAKIVKEAGVLLFTGEDK